MCDTTNSSTYHKEEFSLYRTAFAGGVLPRRGGRRGGSIRHTFNSIFAHVCSVVDSRPRLTRVGWTFKQGNTYTPLYMKATKSVHTHSANAEYACGHVKVRLSNLSFAAPPIVYRWSFGAQTHTSSMMYRKISGIRTSFALQARILSMLYLVLVMMLSYLALRLLPTRSSVNLPSRTRLPNRSSYSYLEPHPDTHLML